MHTTTREAMAFVVCGAALLAFVDTTEAACQTGAGQLRCAVDGVALELGNPTQPESGSGIVLGVAGPADRALAPHRPPSWLTIYVQRFTNDPSNCHRFGNETYCY
jgi:hypothetical protein